MNKVIGVLLLQLLLWAGASRADDIDIYLQTKPGSVPLVMLMIDWRPSVFATYCNSFNDACKAKMSPGAATALANARAAALISLSAKVTKYEVFTAVLESLMTNPAFDPIHMGLMASNFVNGGVILEGYNQLGGPIPANIRSLPTFLLVPPSVSAPGAKYKQYLLYRLRQIAEPLTNASSHKLQPSETFYEMYRYLNGGQVLFSNLLGTALNFQSIIAPLPTYDSLIQTPALPLLETSNYIQPSQLTTSSCSKLNAIVMAMNVANQDDDLDAEIKASMPADNAEKKFENMLDYMADHDLVGNVAGDQFLTTWIISDAGGKGSTAAWAAAGNTGDGVLNFDDAVGLETQLTEAFTKIISASTTFVAASVPVNVFNRTESLDSLFIALFEAQATIAWPGNLKKLRLADSDSDGVFDQILAVSGNSPGALEEVGANKGRIRVGALTYWTNSAALPAPDADKSEVAGADGRSVARGGAGQLIPGFIVGGPGDTNSPTTRNLFVEPAVLATPPTATTLSPLNADAATATALSTLLVPCTAPCTTLDLIKWVRGQDVDDVDSDNNRTEARPWILGASIHSRPLALNYGATGAYSVANQNVHVLMGTADGYFHIFENTTSAGSQSGKELFAFMPRELLANVPKLRANTQASAKMIYGVDGAPAALSVDYNKDGTINSVSPFPSDEVYVYFGLRRGGRSYYALDVSSPSATPKLKWKITHTDADFTELGLTFSDPVVGRVRYGASPVDVVIFAGGYNGGWNADNTARIGKDLNADDDAIGNAIYIVNARTGALIWKAILGTGAATNRVYQHAGLVDSIPSTVATLDSKGTGIIDRLYVADTGGAVWRVDLPIGDGTSANHRRDNWFVSKLAELGADSPAADDRRFFHAPEVVLTFDATAKYDGVLLASGDRAHPLEQAVDNYLLLLKDRAITSGDSAVKTRTAIGIADLPDVSACAADKTATACTLDKTKGWKIRLAGAGEKGLASPASFPGIAFFTTYTPTVSADACDVSEGQGAVYAVNLADGAPATGYVRKYDLGPGIPPSVIPIDGAVIIPGGGIGVDSDGDGIIDRAKPIVPLPTVKLNPVYWREPAIDNIR